MFKFIDRKRQKTLVFIPGWAFDCRVFETVDMPYNYLFFESRTIADIEKGLEDCLRQRDLKKISLFGWSQGAFAASSFAAGHGDIVDEVILVGAKRRYEESALEAVKGLLKKGRRGYLHSFYKECFSPEETDCYAQMRKTLLKDYMETLPLEGLMAGLDWLCGRQIDAGCLKDMTGVKFIHGTDDRIAPIGEARSIAGDMPLAKFIAFERSGHLPFLREDFTTRLYEH